MSVSCSWNSLGGRMQTVLAYSHSHFTNILFFDVLFQERHMSSNSSVNWIKFIYLDKLGSSSTNEWSGNNTPLEFYTVSIASCIQCSSVRISYTCIILLWQMHVHYKGCAVCSEKRDFSEAMTHYVWAKDHWSFFGVAYLETKRRQHQSKENNIN